MRKREYDLQNSLSKKFNPAIRWERICESNEEAAKVDIDWAANCGSRHISLHDRVVAERANNAYVDSVDGR